MKLTRRGAVLGGICVALGFVLLVILLDGLLSACPTPAR